MVILLLTFAGAVALHALWDGFDNTLVYALLGTISLTWLMTQLRRYHSIESHHSPSAVQHVGSCTDPFHLRQWFCTGWINGCCTSAYLASRARFGYLNFRRQ